MTQRRALFLMVVCLIVAATLRLPQLTTAPPGLHYDEAANVVLAGDVGLRGDRPVFIPSYTGKEPLFFYAAGALMALIGQSPLTLRLTSAFVGLLTVAVTYWLGRELLADRRIAVLAAALLAISFWHLIFSRLGFRAISQPLLQGLAVAALFRGLKRSSSLWCLVGGAFMGLSTYTYLAVRLFPVLLGFALLVLLFDNRNMPARLAQLGLFTLAAFMVSLPLLFYFYQHPDAFWVRIGQVGPSPEIATLLQSYGRTLAMFFLVGDPYWRFNIPGRALFDWFWGGLLLVGWATLIMRWRGWWYDWQKASVALLLLAPLVMILPSALAVNEIVPSNLRAIGLIPFIFYLPAVGLIHLSEQLANLLRRPDFPPADLARRLGLLRGYDVNYGLATLLICGLGGAATAVTYFDNWAGRSDLYYESDADLVNVATYLDEQAGDSEAIFVAAQHYRHPTVAALSEHYNEIRWLPQSQALVFPASGPARYVFPHSSPVPLWMETYLPAPVQGPTGPDGEPTFYAYALNSTPTITYSHPAGVDFGGVITLLGYDVQPGPAGETLPLTLYWQVQRPADQALMPFVHLEDGSGHRWSQVESFAYPAEQWASGDTIVQQVQVPAPPGTPPGRYQLRVGLFDPETGERLPRLDEGRYAGISFLVEEAQIVAGRPPQDLPQAPLGQPTLARPGLRLLGYERGPATVAQGEALPLALWWHAFAPQPDLRERLELLRPDDTGLILHDGRPVQDTYPLRAWTTPQFVIDRLDPQIPANFPPGEYRLQLRLLNEANETEFATFLGTVDVQPTERLFTAPRTTYPLAATLGDTIALRGYELDEIESHRYHLSLVWQAIQQPAGDYTVFVHLLHADGTCCLWQQDLFPRQGSYPTGRWLPGEVVIDEYELVLPPETSPGAYALEVGLYDAETGRRLTVTMPDRPAADALLLRPVTVVQEP